MYSYVRAYQSRQIDIAGFIREAKRLGVQGVELLDFFWRNPAVELPEVRALTNGSIKGVSAACILSPTTLSKPAKPNDPPKFKRSSAA